MTTYLSICCFNNNYFQQEVSTSITSLVGIRSVQGKSSCKAQSPPAKGSISCACRQLSTQLEAYQRNATRQARLFSWFPHIPAESMSGCKTLQIGDRFGSSPRRRLFRSGLRDNYCRSCRQCEFVGIGLHPVTRSGQATTNLSLWESGKPPEPCLCLGMHHKLQVAANTVDEAVTNPQDLPHNGILPLCSTLYMCLAYLPFSRSTHSCTLASLKGLVETAEPSIHTVSDMFCQG